MSRVERKFPVLSDDEFSLFQELILHRTGIHLTDGKKALLESRLMRRLRELGFDSYGAYYRHVTEGSDPAETQRLLDTVSTHVTQFFREPKHFEFLERHAYPRWREETQKKRGPRVLRVWSAGCASGEEPYSLAMSLLEHFPPESGWAIEILATDLAEASLEFARRGVWPLEKAREIPPRHLKAFMLKGYASQEGFMRADPKIRSIVHFQRLNLVDDVYPISGPFDLIVCRNVLIYIHEEFKQRIIKRFVEFLRPDGYLILGHSEALTRGAENLRSIEPTVYAKTSEASA